MYFMWLAAIATPAVMYYIWQTALQNKRNNVVKDLEAIDEVLALRLQLIPKLISACGSLKKLDKTFISEISQILSKAEIQYNKYSRDSVAEHLHVVEKLNFRVGRLIINAAALNEDVRDPLITQSIAAYEETEVKISPIRKSYNDKVNDLNYSIAQFPSSFVADMVKISQMPLFNGEHLTSSDSEFKE